MKICTQFKMDSLETFGRTYKAIYRGRIMYTNLHVNVNIPLKFIQSIKYKPYWDTRPIPYNKESFRVCH